ncbi:MAG: phenylalanine--tRNA ligase subunit beta [Alphaproteobacteria bacterium]|nr:phenylalanine--tRNA ligase subunit beta [Alphaproteobacteria bacterium]
MKFTLNWLKRHLDTNASLEEICDKLTAIGLELEDLEDRAKSFAPFTVAEIITANPHPNADKLKVLSVKTKDSDSVQVVCGAPNAKAGMKGIFASEGTYIPGLEVTLKKTKIRGIESNGMMVSEREMCLSDEHEGIIELDNNIEIGTPMAQIFGLDDPIIDIALTPNRADCAGVRGIARDLAAAGLGNLRAQDESAVTGSFKSSINVKIEDKDGCPLFLGRTIKGVKNVQSPKWFQQLLKAIGLRPISALVDITNFMSIDQCRPLHVYDADKINGNITVRETKSGEKLEALNDKTYEDVGNGSIGIYDDNNLIGLGGVIGGVSTGSEKETTNVFLETAYFKPERIARTGRDLSIESDARYRFERGIDPEFTFAGMEIATRLILEFCGGEVSEVVQAGKVPDWKHNIEYDTNYVKQLIGINIEQAQQKTILEALGFNISGNKILSITPPPWRGDVFGKADITEEIIRIIGFDKIPSRSVYGSNTGTPAETPLLTKLRKARNALTARGLNECVTWSFLGHEQAQAFSINDNKKLAAITIQNPISSEIDVMRPSILPNLIQAATQNETRGYNDVALCEVGPVFESVNPEGQKIMAAGIRAGRNTARHWSDKNTSRAVDIYDAKADAIAALEACGAPATNAQITRDAPDYFHPGRSGTLRLGSNVLAYFGELHPEIIEQMNIKTPIIGFEVFLQNIPESKKTESKKKASTEKKYLKLEPLQPIERDFAFLVDENIEASNLLRAVISIDKNLIKDAQIFDIYQGKGVEDGKKSIALNVIIQPKDQTLTDKDIEVLSQKIIANVEKKIGGKLRG